MKVHIASLTTFALVASLACGSERGESELGSKEDPLLRTSVLTDPKTAEAVDSGTKDTGGKYGAVSTGDMAVFDPGATGPTSCAPQRWDVVAQGRTCFDFAGRVSNGTWTVAPILAGGSPTFKSTHCALTFIADAPGCAVGDPYAFNLSCSEIHSLTMRSAACAANPAACGASASTDTGASLAFKAEPDCKPIEIDGGSGGGYVGGCGACGEVYGNTLYITNPFSSSTIATSVTKSDGTTQQLQFTGVAQTTFAVPLTGSYSSGTVAIWR